MATDLSIRAVIENFDQAKKQLDDLNTSVFKSNRETIASTQQWGAEQEKINERYRLWKTLQGGVSEETKKLSGHTAELVRQFQTKQAVMDVLNNHFVRATSALGGFTQETRLASGAVEAFGASNLLLIGGVAGLAVGVGYFVTHLVSAISNTIDWGQQLNNLSQRTGVSAVSLGELSLAAQVSNLGMESLVVGLQQFSKHIVKAGTESDETGNAFQRLGIKVKDSNGHFKSNEVLLGEVAQRFSQTADGATKTEIAMSLFGRAGAALIPLLNQGAAGLEELRDAARRAGIVLSENTVKAADEFNKNLAILGAHAQGFWVQIASPIVEGMAGITSKMVEARKEGGGFWASMVAGLAEFLSTSPEKMKQQIGFLTRQINALAEAGELASDKFRDLVAQRNKLFEDLLATGASGGAVGGAAAKPELPGLTNFKKRLEEERKALIENLRQEQEDVTRAVHEQQKVVAEQIKEELDGINHTAFLTREQKIAALEELLVKYENLQYSAPEAYRQISNALRVTAADTRTFSEELSIAMGRQLTLQGQVAGSIVDLRGITSHELAEMLRGHQNFGTAVHNIWARMKDRIVDRLAELAVDAAFRAIAMTTAFKAAAAASSAAWTAFAATAQAAFASISAAGIASTGPIAVAFLAMIDTIRNPFESLVIFMTTGFLGFSEVIKKVFGADFIKDLVKSVTDAFKAVGQAIIEFFKEIADKIKDIILGSIPGGSLLGGGGGGGGLGVIIDPIGSIGGGLGGLFQHGGEQIVTRPTTFMAGEMGAERVSVTPLSFGGGKGRSGQTMNFYGPVMMDAYTWKLWQRQLMKA